MSLIDRRLLDVRIAVQAVANEPAANPTAGMQYIVGSSGTGAFADVAENSIAEYDGTNWKFITPTVNSLEVLNIATKQLLRYNGTAWTAVVTFNDVDMPISVTHTLTATEITNKSFTLATGVKTGYESGVILFFSGVAQLAGTDFTASGTTISWNGKGLADIDLKANDVLLLHYVPAA